MKFQTVIGLVTALDLQKQKFYEVLDLVGSSLFLAIYKSRNFMKFQTSFDTNTLLNLQKQKFYEVLDLVDFQQRLTIYKSRNFMKFQTLTCCFASSIYKSRNFMKFQTYNHLYCRESNLQKQKFYEVLDGLASVPLFLIYKSRNFMKFQTCFYG